MASVRSTLQRAIQNRWIALIGALLIGYVSVRVFTSVIEGGYWDYYMYPRLKGDEYTFPEIRYTLGQIAMLLWSLLGLWTTGLLVNSSLFRNQHKWTISSVIAFCMGFPVLIVGFLIGMSLRGIV